MESASVAQPMTIHEAAERTGWSARMLRYVERLGLLAPGRSGAGYRLYGQDDLRRLLTLRDLLARFELDLGEVGFARRMHEEPELRDAIEDWLLSEGRREGEMMTTTTEAA